MHIASLGQFMLFFLTKVIYLSRSWDRNHVELVAFCMLSESLQVLNEGSQETSNKPSQICSSQPNPEPQLGQTWISPPSTGEERENNTKYKYYLVILQPPTHHPEQMPCVLHPSCSPGLTTHCV